jgi:O-antigen ligase
VYAAPLALMLAASATIDRADRLWITARWIVGAAALTSVYGLAQRFGLDPMPWDDAEGKLGNAPATFGNPNFAAHTIVLALILAGGLLWRIRKPVYSGFVILFLVHLFLTGARGAWGGLGIACILVVLGEMGRRFGGNPKRATSIAVMGTVLIGVVAFGAVTALNNASTGSPVPVDRSLRLRYQSIRSAAAMVQEQPLLGSGPGHYRIESPAYWTDLERDRFVELYRQSVHAHNEPIEIAAEGGLLAGAAYLAFLLFAMAAGLRLAAYARDRETRIAGWMLSGLFVAFAVDGLFGFNLHTPSSAAIAGVMAGILVRLDSKNEAETAMATRVTAVALLVALTISGTMAGREWMGQYHERQGRFALDRVDLEDAEQAFVESVRWAPYRWDAQYLLGQARLRQEKTVKAMQAFDATLACNPQYHLALFEKAKILFNRAKFAERQLEAIDEAVAFVEDAADKVGVYPAMWELNARALLLRASLVKNGNPESAETNWDHARSLLDKCVEEDPARAVTYWELIASLEMQRNRLDRAEEALMEGLFLSPDHALLWMTFRGLAEKSGRQNAYEDAMRAVNRRVVMR